jgi:DNA binding domain, excisionase family
MLNNYSDDILTVEQLCEILYIGRNTAYKLLNSGKLGAFRIGRNWKIPNAALETYITRNANK